MVKDDELESLPAASAPMKSVAVMRTGMSTIGCLCSGFTFRLVGDGDGDLFGPSNSSL